MRDNGAHLAQILRVGLPREKGEWSMKRFKKSGALAAIFAAALLCLLAPRAGAQTGSISGTILEVNGKPWAEGVIRAVSDQGAKRTSRRATLLSIKRSRRRLICRRRPRTSAMRSSKS